MAAEWGPASVHPQRRVAVNVGGQRFETTAGVLTRDRFSLLAALTAAACSGTGPGAADAPKPSVAATVLSAGGPQLDAESKEQAGPPQHPAEDAAASAEGALPAETSGAKGEEAGDAGPGDAAEPPPASAVSPAPAPAELFLDRDWWLFRHVIAFLRAGPAALPADIELLRQLYVESAFLRLNSLRVSIERRLAERRVSLAVLDPEFAAAPLTTDMARHGSAGRAGEVAAAADEALSWARWARSNGGGGGGGGAGMPGPLSGAMGGVRNAAALFAAAELESGLPADTEAAGLSTGHDYGLLEAGDNDEFGGVGLAELVGAVEGTARRRARLRDAAAERGVDGAGRQDGWWQWRDDLAAGADAADGMPGIEGGAEAAIAAAMVGGVTSSASLLTAAWHGPAYGSR